MHHRLFRRRDVGRRHDLVAEDLGADARALQDGVRVEVAVHLERRARQHAGPRLRGREGYRRAASARPGRDAVGRSEGRVGRERRVRGEEIGETAVADEGRVVGQREHLVDRGLAVGHEVEVRRQVGAESIVLGQEVRPLGLARIELRDLVEAQPAAEEGLHPLAGARVAEDVLDHAREVVLDCAVRRGIEEGLIGHRLPEVVRELARELVRREHRAIGVEGIEIAAVLLVIEEARRDQELGDEVPVARGRPVEGDFVRRERMAQRAGAEAPDEALAAARVAGVRRTGLADEIDQQAAAAGDLARDRPGHVEPPLDVARRDALIEAREAVGEVVVRDLVEQGLDLGEHGVRIRRPELHAEQIADRVRVLPLREALQGDGLHRVFVDRTGLAGRRRRRRIVGRRDEGREVREGLRLRDRARESAHRIHGLERVLDAGDARAVQDVRDVRRRVPAMTDPAVRRIRGGAGGRIAHDRADFAHGDALCIAVGLARGVGHRPRHHVDAEAEAAGRRIVADRQRRSAAGGRRAAEGDGRQRARGLGIAIRGRTDCERTRAVGPRRAIDSGGAAPVIAAAEGEEDEGQREAREESARVAGARSTAAARRCGVARGMAARALFDDPFPSPRPLDLHHAHRFPCDRSSSRPRRGTHVSIRRRDSALTEPRSMTAVTIRDMRKKKEPSVAIRPGRSGRRWAGSIERISRGSGTGRSSSDVARLRTLARDPPRRLAADRRSVGGCS